MVLGVGLQTIGLFSPLFSDKYCYPLESTGRLGMLFQAERWLEWRVPNRCGIHFKLTGRELGAWPGEVVSIRIMAAKSWDA